MLGVHRYAVILLLLAYAGLGSGALEFLHNAQHAAEDAQTSATSNDSALPVHSPVHDESNCPTHSRLHLALLAVASVPLLICLGLFVAFLTLLPKSLPTQYVLYEFPCRGPPIL